MATLRHAWLYLQITKANLEYAEAYQRYAEKAGEEHQKSAAKIARECEDAAILGGSVKECLTEAIVAYQGKDTDYKDLQAQQEMAFWARVMVYVGAVGIPISIVGLIAIVASLAQTRRAIRNDREIGAAQVRAYLTIDAATIEPEIVEGWGEIYFDVFHREGRPPILDTWMFAGYPEMVSGTKAKLYPLSTIPAKAEPAKDG